MAVAHDGTSNVTVEYNAATSVTASSKTSSGSDRCAVLHIGHLYAANLISGVTYGGSAMTFVEADERANGVYAALYRYVAPATTASDVVMSFDGSIGHFGAVCVSSYNGVDQTTPIRASASANGSSGTSSVDVSSATGDVVVDAQGIYGTQPTAGGGQTSMLSTAGGSSGGMCSGASREAGATTVTMSWTHGSDQWAIAAMSLKAAGAAAATSYPVFRSSVRFFRRSF
jgi:hypothetical protein